MNDRWMWIMFIAIAWIYIFSILGQWDHMEQLRELKKLQSKCEVKK